MNNRFLNKIIKGTAHENRLLLSAILINKWLTKEGMLGSDVDIHIEGAGTLKLKFDMELEAHEEINAG